MLSIAAMTASRIIGYQNRIPWYYPEDLRWFKKTTMGHPILMGRKTFESLGKPLPGRRNLVLSRTATFDGVEMIRDLKNFNPALYEKEVMVIGGAEIYSALLPKCDTLIITKIKKDYIGDTYFPEFESDFALTEVIAKTPDFDIVRYGRMAHGE
jgi:dihydrofolate reductase